jgi:predicted secreted protein
LKDLELTLSVGEGRKLTLPSLGTSGFVWRYDLEASKGILRLTRLRGGPKVAGTRRSTDERLMIHAKAPGYAMIRMRQARPWPWETEVAPRPSFTIVVQVVP